MDPIAYDLTKKPSLKLNVSVNSGKIKVIKRLPLTHTSVTFIYEATATTFRFLQKIPFAEQSA
jgi:hypothetical protein